jgi:hypothetical protein
MYDQQGTPYIDPTQQGNLDPYHIHQLQLQHGPTPYIDYTQGPYSQEIMKTMVGVKYPINRVVPTTQRSPQPPQRTPQSIPKTQFIPYTTQQYAILPQMAINPRGNPPLLTNYEEDDEPLQIAKNRPRRVPKKPERHIESLPKKRKTPPEIKKPRNYKKKELPFHSPELPHHILKAIFSYLQPLPSMMTFQRVCKYWRDYLISKDPWEPITCLNFSQLRMDHVSQSHIDMVVSRCPNLGHLVFVETVVDEDLCKSLSFVPTLRHVTFAFCQFTNIPLLASCLGTITRLSLCSDMNRGPGLTLEELNTLVAGAKNLKDLDFEWSKIREDLNKVPELSHLGLTGSHESFKSDIPSQFALQLIAVYRKYDLSPNSHYFIQQMQKDLAQDWVFAHSAILLGLDVNSYVNKENDTLLHLEMKKAEAIMAKWKRLRREISAFHTFTVEHLNKQREEWELQVAEITTHIVFLLSHEANIKQKNSRKRSCLDMGTDIDNEIASVHFFQEDRPVDDDDDEDEVKTTIPIFPFSERYFGELFDSCAIMLPKKRRNRTIIKKKPVVVVELEDIIEDIDDADEEDEENEESIVEEKEHEKSKKTVVEEEEKEENSSILLGDPLDDTHTYLK